MKPAIIVHGGAWDMPDDLVAPSQDGCDTAAAAGYEVLRKGGTSLDAIEAAIHVLEESPYFDAGRGSFLNIDGRIELDAGIMDGRTLACGAVGAVEGLLHPISLARRVMDSTSHTFLVGAGATKFAKEQGFQLLPYEELLVDSELEYWKKIKDDDAFDVRVVFEGAHKPHPSDTVGAVAIDTQGNIAAGTSTGGIPKKMAGRVGDSPIVGSGFYADNTLGGASSTGWGEQIMKVVLCKTALDFLAQGMNPNAAAKRSVSLLKEKVGGTGGIILIAPDGNLGFAHNTPRMAYAYISG